jgi:hypothetical protein
MCFHLRGVIWVMVGWLSGGHDLRDVATSYDLQRCSQRSAESLEVRELERLPPTVQQQDRAAGPNHVHTRTLQSLLRSGGTGRWDHDGN